MSKRAELHKEYFKQFGTRKGTSKVSEHYVKWLEDKVIDLKTEHNGFRNCPRCNSSDLFDIDDHYTKCFKCQYTFVGL